MNFHISPLSPLRPQFSGSLSPNSSAARRGSPFGPDDDTNHDTVGSVGQPKIEVDGVEADDELASSATGSGSGSGSDSDISADDITQDSRDVLVQRLNDLAQRLSGANVRTENIEALHAQVDAMEKVLSRRGHRSSPGRRRTPSSSSARRSVSLQPGGSRPRSLVLPAGGDGRDALGIMAPMSPSWLRSHFQRRPSSTHGDRPDETSELHKAAPVPMLVPSAAQQLQPVEATATFSSSPKISSAMADSIVLEAENLCAEMSTVIESLQKRREESDHLHAVSVEREESANERLRQQEARIHELEEAVEEDESELRYLKIQLRAIETQCAGYVPPGADPDLEQSIRFWKRDWEELRDKWAARRGTLLQGREDESGSFSGLTSPSSAR